MQDYNSDAEFVPLWEWYAIMNSGTSHILMKPLAYYQTLSVSIPKQDDYMTIYYYKNGVMIGVKKQFESGYESPKNCVEEHVLDEDSYNAHLNHYQGESIKLQEEFRDDLIFKYKMTGHPKANQLFNKAWDIGGSILWDVEDYFASLIELIHDDKVDFGVSLFDAMVD